MAEIQRSPEQNQETGVDTQKIMDKVNDARKRGLEKKVAANMKSNADSSSDGDFAAQMKALRQQQMAAAQRGEIGNQEQIGGGIKGGSEATTTIEQSGNKINSGPTSKIENSAIKLSETQQAISDMLNGENPKIVRELIQNGQINKADYVAAAGIKLQKDRGWSAGQARINAGRAYDVMSKS